MMKDAQSPDEVCELYSDRSVELALTVIGPDPEDAPDDVPFVLVEGTADALRFLAKILIAVADDETQDSSFQLSPTGAGSFHFSPAAEVGLYVHRLSKGEGEPSTA